MSPKKTISKNEYLQLQGLITIGQHHNAKANEALDAAYELMGYEPRNYEGDSGHIDDAFFDGNAVTAKEVLRKMNVKVR